MTTTRTKQQINFDGVRNTWYADTFTEILHHQVTTQFSMDGVIPQQGIAHKTVDSETLQKKQPVVESLRQARARYGKFAGNIDGVRLPWKQQALSA